MYLAHHPFVFDDMVEYVADKSPDGEVESGCWWYPAQTSEQDREVDLPTYIFLSVSCVEPQDDRSNCT